MGFTCTHCNYKTNDKSNYNRHNSSTAHIKRKPIDNPQIAKLENKKYVCMYCNNSFSKSSNVRRHERTCKTKELETYKLKNEIVELKTVIHKHEEKELNELKNEIAELKVLVGKHENVNIQLLEICKNKQK